MFLHKRNKYCTDPYNIQERKLFGHLKFFCKKFTMGDDKLEVVADGRILQFFGTSRIQR